MGIVRIILSSTSLLTVIIDALGSSSLLIAGVWSVAVPVEQ
jgi:hypothetical protein